MKTRTPFFCGPSFFQFLLTALLLAPLEALYAADAPEPNGKSKSNIVLAGSPAREALAVLEARSPIEQPYG